MFRSHLKTHHNSEMDLPGELILLIMGLLCSRQEWGDSQRRKGGTGREESLEQCLGDIWGKGGGRVAEKELWKE